MNLRPAGVVVLAVLVAGCGSHGATQFEGQAADPVAEFGQCAFCHSPMATNMVGSAPDLKCQVCHADQEPGMVGPGHRAIPGPNNPPPYQQVPSFPGPSHLLRAEAPFGSCAYCHNQNGLNMAPTHGELLCPVCHDNVLTGVYGPGHRSVPGPERVPVFPNAMHLLQEEAPFDSCAFCHNDKAVNMAPTRGELLCPVCHDNALPGVYGRGHRSVPGAERVPAFPNAMHLLNAEAPFDSCAFCHNDKAVNMVPVNGDLKCEVCHDNQMPGNYGPGHRSLPGPDRVPSFVGPSHLPPPAEVPIGSCAYCHNEFAKNVAPVSADLKCVDCHADQRPGQFGPGHRKIPGPELVPSFAGPTHSIAAEAALGSCAFCHNDVAMNVAPVSADLKCVDCHADQRPGEFGPGHRRIPGPDMVPSFAGPTHSIAAEAPLGSCAFCHNQFAMNVAPVSADLKCVDCHADQQPGEFGPGHRHIPGPDLVPAFAGPMHALGPLQSFGSCAFCHNDKGVNMRASGVGVACTFCHATALLPDFGPGHRSFPGPDQVQSFAGPAHKLGPEAVYGQCGFCHNELTVKALMSSGHGNLSLVCENCHSVLRPNDYGPGHERAPRCAECHAQQHTHQDPAVGTVRECTACHTPHGSMNILLINEQILTPSGTARSVVFNNILGLADGSFASVTQPGTGLCETCHTRTEFYRSDGTGGRHFPYACFTCHPHAAGFAPN